MVSITRDRYQAIFSLVIDITFLIVSDKLFNVAHFASSNAYNFLIYEQKHQVLVGIFLVSSPVNLFANSTKPQTNSFRKSF